MSLQIKNDHPFTDFEKQYLNDRGKKSLVAKNAIDFPNTEVESVEVKSVSLDTDIFELVKGLDPEAVKTQLRESGVEFDDASETKVLKSALAKYLQGKRYESQQ